MIKRVVFPVVNNPPSLVYPIYTPTPPPPHKLLQKACRRSYYYRETFLPQDSISSHPRVHCVWDEVFLTLFDNPASDVELFWNKVVEGLPIILLFIKKKYKKDHFCLFSSSLNLHRVGVHLIIIFLIPLHCIFTD